MGRLTSCYAPGALASFKASGLSSSSYEQSQYINGAEQIDPAPQPTWSTADTEHAAVPEATAPLTYSLPHALVSFGPAGQLIRRNFGSDIAELLMRNSQGHGGSGGSEGSEAPTLIDLIEGPSPETDPMDGADLLTGTAASVCMAESTEKDMQGYTKLLLAGRKKEALELAMKSGLWGHALFLASKMENRSYTTVLNR
ncbi:unnamed protein product [Coregonus sp. 'balchen']|nr:unnamed protein product [Coregonus sp. 'balchen']